MHTNTLTHIYTVTYNYGNLDISKVTDDRDSWEMKKPKMPGSIGSIYVLKLLLLKEVKFCPPMMKY